MTILKDWINRKNHGRGRKMTKHCKAGSLPTFKRQVEEIPKTISPREEKIKRKETVRNRWQTRKFGHEIRNRPGHQQQQADQFPDWQFTEARNFGEFIPRNPDQPSTSKALPDEMPMKEGEIPSDSELAPLGLEIPTINWANKINWA